MVAHKRYAIKGTATVGVVLGLAIALPFPAYAQIQQSLLPDLSPFKTSHHVSVRERVQPDAQLYGYQLGAINLHPQIRASEIYDDNIYALRSGSKTDFITRIEPSLLASAKGTGWNLSGYALGQFDRYARTPTENGNQWAAGSSGILELNDTTTITAGIQQRHDLESRQSQNSFVITRNPVESNQTSAGGSITKSFGRLITMIEGTWAHKSFNNAALFDGTIIDETTRDNDTTRIRGRISYEQSPSLRVFTELTYDMRSFEKADVTLPKRDSKGYRILGGLTFDAAAPVRGEIGVGYLSQNFKYAPYTDFSGVAVNGKLEIFPTGLSTVTLTANRSVSDAGIPGVAGFLATTFSGRLDHELTRRLILSAFGSYETDRYNGLDQHDQRGAWGTAASYSVTPEISLGLRYDGLKLTSSAKVREFMDNRVLLSFLMKK